MYLLAHGRKKILQKCNEGSTSRNQSYSEKKRGRPNKSETAPSAVGIDPRFPPLKKFVNKLLALSNKFLDFVFSVLVDSHLHFKQGSLIIAKTQKKMYNHKLTIMQVISLFIVHHECYKPTYSHHFNQLPYLLSSKLYY